jgi:hypothetical protein
MEKRKTTSFDKMVLTIVVFTAQSVFNFENWFTNIVIVEALTDNTMFLYMKTYKIHYDKIRNLLK